MRIRIKPLPHWCLTDLQPAFYDTESGTALQMVSRIYGKIEELIFNYNSYIDELNKYIFEFENGIITDFDEFKTAIENTINDFTQSIDLKIETQDDAIETMQGDISNQNDVIANAVEYMETNLNQTVNNLFTQLLEEGRFVSTVGVTYDADDERIDIEDTLEHAESEEF